MLTRLHFKALHYNLYCSEYTAAIFAAKTPTIYFPRYNQNMIYLKQFLRDTLFGLRALIAHVISFYIATKRCDLSFPL